MLLSILLLIALYIFTKHFLHKIQNHPPTPLLNLPIIGHLYLIKKPLHRALHKISTKYGPVTLLELGSRRVLVVSSPSAAEECLSKHDTLFANRPRLLVGKYIGSNYTSPTWAPYGDHWRNLRRIMSLEILSSYRVQMLSSTRAAEVKVLLRHLKGHVNQVVNMKSAFFGMMLNVMMRMIAGKRYYGDDVTCDKEVETFKEIVAETFKLAESSNIDDFLPTFGFVGSEKKLIKLKENRNSIMQNLIEEHRRAKKERRGSVDGNKTMIEVLLSLQETEPEHYNDDVIIGIISVILTAGSDTSIATLEWAMSLLLNNPEVLKKAQAEIDNVVGNDHLIVESDLAKLPYLHCIIKETHRICPPAPLLLPHESSKECTIGGHHVPPGTMLLVNLWTIQNDPKIWESPREFRPERFEGSEGSRDGYRLMPFGTGRRSCPGEGLGMHMVKLALGSILQCFNWARVDENLVDLTEGVGLTMPKALPLQAQCSARPAMAKLLSQI